MTASTFAWLDFSQAERESMTRIIDLFRETDTRDELGIGAVRDTFSNLLFPGTSTIQTRARYFLFVPWIFQEMESRRVASRTAPTWSRNRELQLIEALEAGGESSGVIGIVARKRLKRLPSSVYWQGLGTFGIRRFPGSVEDYFRSLDVFYHHDRRVFVSDDGEVLDRYPRNWHGGIPPRPKDLLERTTFDLTREEARYLRDRIVTQVPESLLAHLVSEQLPAEVDFPWFHPSVARFPAHLQTWLSHARNLSEAVHGAPLLYNLMLAEKAERPDLQEVYRGALEDWAERLHARRSQLEAWDRKALWGIVTGANPNIRTRTRRFIDSWLDVALDDPYGIPLSEQARDLIGRRERTLKGPQARLSNPNALQTWNEAAGTARLEYRWRIARRIVDDIVGGLRRSSDARA